MAGMITLTMHLTSSEWMKVKQAADLQWSGERMSSGEICRRYTLAGVQALKGLSDADRARVQREHQATMAVGGREARREAAPGNGAVARDSDSDLAVSVWRVRSLCC
jgi:hypothetical protein